MSDRRSHSDLDAALDHALRAVRADADPRALARALDALDRRRALPAWLTWGMRPQALAAACALLAVSAVFAWTLDSRIPSTTPDDPAALAAAIQSEIEGAGVTESAEESAVPSDSGVTL